MGVGEELVALQGSEGFRRLAKSLLPKGAAEEAHKYIMKSKTLPQLLQLRLGSPVRSRSL